MLATWTQSSRVSGQRSVMVVKVDKTHARYATVREGSLLKCSDSMKRSRRFQLMEAGAQGVWWCCVQRLAWAQDVRGLRYVVQAATLEMRLRVRLTWVREC